jgi:hypothetical protein
LTKGVCCKHGIEHFSWSDHARFVMNGLAWSAGLFSRPHQLFTVGISKTDGRKRRRQADLLTE